MERDPRKHLGKGRGCLLHKGRMEASRNLERNSSASRALHIRSERFHFRAQSRDRNLPGTIIIDGIDGRIFRAELPYLFVIQLDNRRHGGICLFRCRLHQLCAPAHKPESGLHVDHSGKGERCKLSERKPGGRLRTDSMRRKDPCRGKLHGKQTRLSVAGFLQLLLRAGKAHLRRSRADGVA